MSAKPGAKKHKHYSLDENKILKAKSFLVLRRKLKPLKLRWMKSLLIANTTNARGQLLSGS